MDIWIGKVTFPCISITGNFKSTVSLRHWINVSALYLQRSRSDYWRSYIFLPIAGENRLLSILSYFYSNMRIGSGIQLFNKVLEGRQ